MSKNFAYDRLWLALKQSRPIAFGLFLARMAGNPKAAIVLSQLAHWTRTGRDVAQTNGWIFKTQQQWWLETGLSRAELDTARRRLRNLGFVEETLAGRPATLWYRMNLPNIARALEVCRKEALPVELTFEFMRAPERAVRDLLGPTTAYHRILADVTGGVNAGLLLSRLLQLQRRSVESGYPWFSLTALNWQEDLALNRRSLENAKDRLKALGLVQEFHLKPWVRAGSVAASMPTAEVLSASAGGEPWAGCAGAACPTCGAGKLVSRVSSTSDRRFLGCSKFPKCRHFEWEKGNGTR